MAGQPLILASQPASANSARKKAAEQGINVDRALQGFAALEQFVRGGRAGKRPRDGYFVTLMRLLLNYPELLQWEALWINSRKQLMLDIRNRVKSINASTPVGFHVWHNASFSPFYRAEIDLAGMAKNADFIKPVLYNTCAGTRMKTFVNSVGQTIFGDVPPAELLQMMYEMLDCREAGLDQVAATGFFNGFHHPRGQANAGRHCRQQRAGVRGAGSRHPRAAARSLSGPERQRIGDGRG